MVAARPVLVALGLLLATGPLFGQTDTRPGGRPDAREEPACNPAELEQAAGMHREGVVPFTLVASGPFADRREEGVEVVTSPDEWNRLPERGLIEDSLPAPNFAEGSVFVVYAGRRPTAGYKVTVESLRRQADGTLLIQGRVQGPPEGTMAATVVTSPYVVIEASVLSTDFNETSLELGSPSTN